MTREECIARYRAEELRSRTGATVTMLSKLKDAKYREEYGLYLAEGVKLAEEAGIRDQVKIMVGGAPLTAAFAEKIGADAYTADAATAADVAAEYCA